MTTIELSEYISEQLFNFFPDCDEKIPLEAMNSACDKINDCLIRIDRKYFRGEFDLFHGDHYAMFLYLLSREVFLLQGEVPLAKKLFLLNKALHGIDVFYEIVLPRTFLFIHPVGTVLGRATYGDYFTVYQNCTVGSDVGGGYPAFGEGVTLYSGVSVIGNCKVGNFVTFGARAFILDCDIWPTHTVVGQYPNHHVFKGKANEPDKMGFIVKKKIKGEIS